LLAALALALVAGAPTALAGKPVGIAERFPTKCTVTGVAAAPGGGAWFSCFEFLRKESVKRAAAGLVGADGKIVEYPGTALPAGSEPGVGAEAADGSFWFAVEPELSTLPKFPVTPSIAHMTPAGLVADVPLGLPATASVDEIVAAPNGYLWFVTTEGFEFKNAALWQIDPTGALARTAVGLAPTGLPRLAVGTDGNLWWGAGGEGITAPLSRFTPAGEFSTTADPAAGLAARLPAKPNGGIVTGSVLGAEGNLFYGVQSGSRSAIGRMTPAGATTEFSRCLSYGQPFFGPEELTRGAEGNVWFTSLAERSTPNIVDPPSIGLITPEGKITQIFAGVEGRPTSVAPADAGVWFAEGGAVGRVRPPAGPVNTFHVGKVKVMRGNGTGLLSVKVPGPGRLQVKPVAFLAGAKHERERLHGPAATASTKVCGTPQVRLRPPGESRVAFQVEGVARVYYRVTFTPAGGTPYSEERLLVFKAPRRH
jgi:streptogramin lyase